jgi:capsular polysaccharide biosynthesis protein
MEINFSRYLKAIIRYWWLILAMVFLSIGVGVAYSNMQTSIYESEIAFVTSPNLAITDTGDLINGIEAVVSNTELTTTTCEILESSIIRAMAAQQLNIPLSLAESYDINCVVIPDSTILQVQVQGVSPELASDLANAVGDVSAVYINELYEIVKLGLLDPAEANYEAVSPDHRTNIMMSAIIGLVAAVGFIILRETLLQLWGKPEDSD